MDIPFNRPFVTGKELAYIAEAISSGHLSGDGTFSKRCHQWIESTLGSKMALLTHSCTGALEMAAILCDLEAGDEVIMPAFTFPSTANAVVLRGATPVFVDIRADTFNLDEDLIEAAITPRTKAIFVVHYAGVGCEMDKIMDIARQHDLLVVEDAAQGILSRYNGRFLGTVGDIGALSFHESKNVISGEGGAIIVNNEKFCERAEIIREKGTNRTKFFRGEISKYNWVDIGSSYLPERDYRGLSIRPVRAGARADRVPDEDLVVLPPGFRRMREGRVAAAPGYSIKLPAQWPPLLFGNARPCRPVSPGRRPQSPGDLRALSLRTAAHIPCWAALWPSAPPTSCYRTSGWMSRAIANLDRHGRTRRSNCRRGIVDNASVKRDCEFACGL